MVPIHTCPPPSILISTLITYLIIDARMVMPNSIRAGKVGYPYSPTSDGLAVPFPDLRLDSAPLKSPLWLPNRAQDQRNRLNHLLAWTTFLIQH
jgi:hypothetical protein